MLLLLLANITLTNFIVCCHQTYICY